MNFNNILNQVLGVAKEQISKTANGNSTADKITKIGGGAAALGLLSMVLGRNGGSNLAKLGSLAALGSVAYQAYQSYQQKQSQSAPVSEETFLSVEKNENAGQIILRAMIAAAAADGIISETEKQAIFNEAGNNPELQKWIEQELTQPVSVAEIAKMVGNDTALATQVYLAARITCADLARKEIIFLANLAEALNLNEQLVEQLEKEAGF